MNPNESRTLWISVGSALFAVFLLYSYTQEKTAQLSKEFGTKSLVVVASSNIKEMEPIDETMLKVISMPTKFIHADSLSNPEDVVGKVALAPIKEGEMLLSSKIVKPSPTTGLSLQVAPGKRALTLPTDDVRGVARLIKPGDRVDILAAVDVGTGIQQKKEIRTIMQDVLILATGLRVANELPRLHEKRGDNDYIKNIRSDTSFSNVTIEVSQTDAQKLIYILSTNPSSMYFTLRHPSDRGVRPGLAETTVESIRNMVSTSVISKQINSAPAPVERRVASPPPIPQPVKPKRKSSRSKNSGGFQGF